MIKAIIFDLDDTLLWDKKSVKESFRAVCLEVEAKTGIPHELFEETAREEARKLYAELEIYPFTKMIGINPFEGLWGTFTDKTNIGFRKMNEVIFDYQKNTWINALKRHDVVDESYGKYLAERFRFHRRKLPFLYEDTMDVLVELKKDYRLFLLTNGSPTLQNEKLEMTPQLVPFFEYILVSGAFGIGKPDPSIFEHALRLLSLSNEEAIMVGDNLNTDILGSNRVNMKNIWMNRDGQTEAHVPFDWEVQSLSEIPPLLKKLK